eukprot:scaffold103307_cov63-Phaeocystis_antarctica.AAC.3
MAPVREAPDHSRASLPRQPTAAAACAWRRKRRLGAARARARPAALRVARAPCPLYFWYRGAPSPPSAVIFGRPLSLSRAGGRVWPGG